MFKHLLPVNWSYVFAMNTSPNDTIFDWSEFIRLADHELKIARMAECFLDTVENIVGNGVGNECCLPALSHFPTFFKKDFFPKGS